MSEDESVPETEPENEIPDGIEEPVAPLSQDELARRVEPFTLQLHVVVPPNAQACAWEFAQRIFRVEYVTWQGPALVNWLGQSQSSPFEPREWPEHYGPPPPGEKVPSYRVYRIGEPICFVVRNPTPRPLEVVLRASGTTVL